MSTGSMYKRYIEFNLIQRLKSKLKSNFYCNWNYLCDYPMDITINWRIMNVNLHIVDLFCGLHNEDWSRFEADKGNVAEFAAPVNNPTVKLLTKKWKVLSQNSVIIHEWTVFRSINCENVNFIYSCTSFMQIKKFQPTAWREPFARWMKT